MKRLLVFVSGLILFVGCANSEISSTSQQNIDSTNSIVSERYKRGQKKFVNVYIDNGTAERLTKRYFYEEYVCNNIIKGVMSFDSIGGINSITEYFDCSSKIDEIQKYDYERDKVITIRYNEDGTVREGYPFERPGGLWVSYIFL